MYMILAHFCFYNFYTFLFAQLSDNLTYVLFYFSVYFFSSVLRCEHYMIWHLYVECDNVFISLFPFFFIMFLTFCILVTRLPNRFNYTRRLFFRQYSRLALSSAVLFLLKLFIFSPRLNRGFNLCWRDNKMLWMILTCFNVEEKLSVFAWVHIPIKNKQKIYFIVIRQYLGTFVFRGFFMPEYCFLRRYSGIFSLPQNIVRAFERF